MLRTLGSLLAASLLTACATPPAPPCPPCAAAEVCPACPACPACPVVEPPKPAEKPIQPAAWTDLPGWQEEDPRTAFEAFRASCRVLEKQALWRPACDAAAAAALSSPGDTRAWFEARFQPWVLVNPDGSREGLVTGYYEPLLKGSRKRHGRYAHPLHAPPEDMVVVEMAELYPELKHLRLRGRLDGRRLVPYFSRAEWSRQEAQRQNLVLFWIDDPLDLFFMQIQGSGQVALDDGSRVRVGYADQNGHPYRSIGKWLVDQGELKPEQASMQGIKSWARTNPRRLEELLNVNPSLVFFRELPIDGSGPPGALGVPLTPERSIAIDPRIVPLGAPVYLATTWPNDSQPLKRLMLAQDTGGAIRGAVRADFYWGSGAEAGARAGRMRQKGSMWLLMPRAYVPEATR